VTVLYKVDFSTSTGRWSDQYYFTSRPVLVGRGDQYWFDRQQLLLHPREQPILVGGL